MKLFKLLSICFTILFVQNGYSQNENLGVVRTYNFKQQVENKLIEVIIDARAGEFLAGETYFHFKLKDIIIHTWEFDGKFYDKNNSNGVLPVSGKMGFIYADVKIKTINNAPNEYWEKTGFQIQKITSFEDIPYEGKRDNHFWITYAHVSDCKIGSVYIEDWMELQKRIKGEKVNSSKNSSSNNSNVENSNTANNSNTDKELEKINKILNDPNFTANNPQLIQQVSNLILQTDFDNEASVNKYIEDVQKIVSNYIGISNETQSKTTQSSRTNNSKTATIEQVAKEMNLRSDEVEILEIFKDSKNINEAYSKLKEKNIQSLNKYTLDALNKIVGTNNDFSISGSDIQTLLNGGSLTDVLKNVNVKNANKIAQGLGLDANQTQVLNIIASSGSKEEMIEGLNNHNIQQISQTTANALNKLLGDSYDNLPISSSDVTNMLNGDFNTAIQNIGLNQMDNILQDGLGVGLTEVQGLMEIAGGVASLFEASPEEKERRRKERETKREKKWQEKFDKQFNIERAADGSSKQEIIDEINDVKLIQFYDKNGQLLHSESYDLTNGKLVAKTENISPTEFILIDIENKKSARFIFSENFTKSKVIDNLTDEVLYDSSKIISEDIKDKNGTIIGMVEIFNGIKKKSIIKFEGKKEENMYDENGSILMSNIYTKKDKLTKLEVNMIKSNPEFEESYKYNLFQTNNYYPNGQIKTITTYSKDMRNTEKKYFDNGVLTITKKFKDGKLVSKEK